LRDNIFPIRKRILSYKKRGDIAYNFKSKVSES